MKIRDVTVFKSAEISFASGLNVITGENGTGKSHVLKFAYRLMAAMWQPQKKESPAEAKDDLQARASAKLVGVLQPESLGRLARPKGACELALAFDETADDCALSFSAESEEVTFGKLPERWQPTAPVFFPARELVTLAPYYAAVDAGHRLEYGETHRDACALLRAPVPRGGKSRPMQKLLSEIEEALGGKVVLEQNGRFYLCAAGQEARGMSLVSEGFRKLAMLFQLINNGSLQSTGYFFWDAPEANLHPKLIRLVARILLELCQSGIQVFIATHSLYLLRELSILLGTKKYQKLPHRIIGLQPSDGGTIVESVDSADALTELSMLDEELKQTDRYLEAA